MKYTATSTTPHESTPPMARRAFLALAAASALVGCSRRADTDAKGRKVVRFWTLALSPWFDGYIESQLAKFQKENPGTMVEWTDVAYEALERKLIAAASAGRAPDVVNMSDVGFARFVSLGAFAPLDELTPMPARDRYLPGALGLCVFSGKVFGVPWYVNPQTRLVNTRLLSAGGLTIETLAPDWSGLIAQARDFAKSTGAFLFSQPLGDESQMPIMMLGEGISPLRGAASGPGLEADFSSTEMREFLFAWASLYADGALPSDAATRGHAHLTDLYQDGRLAVINTGPNFLKRIKDTAPRVFEATEVLPGAVGALGRIHLPVMALGVSSQSPHPREAAALAWAITSPEAQTEFCRHAAIMPSTIASLDDPFFKAPEPASLVGAEGRLLAARAVAAATVRDAVAFTASLETWPDLRRSFEEEYKRVLTASRDGSPASPGRDARLRERVDRAAERIEGDWNRILRSAPPASMEGVPRPSRIPVPRVHFPVRVAAVPREVGAA